MDSFTCRTIVGISIPVKYFDGIDLSKYMNDKYMTDNKSLKLLKLKKDDGNNIFFETFTLLNSDKKVEYLVIGWGCVEMWTSIINEFGKGGNWDKTTINIALVPSIFDDRKTALRTFLVSNKICGSEWFDYNFGVQTIITKDT